MLLGKVRSKYKVLNAEEDIEISSLGSDRLNSSRGRKLELEKIIFSVENIIERINQRLVRSKSRACNLFRRCSFVRNTVMDPDEVAARRYNEFEAYSFLLNVIKDPHEMQYTFAQIRAISYACLVTRVGSR